MPQGYRPGLEALRNAVAAGFRELERVEKDTELDALRPLPAFKVLLSELQKQVKVLVWSTDFEAAKSQAAREKKDLFVYFTGSDWCAWCLLVRRDVFGKDAFIDYVPKHFVMVELDFPHHKARPKNYRAEPRTFPAPGFAGLPQPDPGGCSGPALRQPPRWPGGATMRRPTHSKWRNCARSGSPVMSCWPRHLASTDRKKPGAWTRHSVYCPPTFGAIIRKRSPRSASSMPWTKLGFVPSTSPC